MLGFSQSNAKSGNVLANNLRVQQNLNITGEINPENPKRLLSVVGNAAVTNNLQVYGNLTVVSPQMVHLMLLLLVEVQRALCVLIV